MPKGVYVRKPRIITPAMNEQRFWSKVSRGSIEDCWLWQGTQNSTGYGEFKVNGRDEKAHRIAYELLRAPIPEGLHIDHLCRVPLCVNPWHLEPVTPKVNSLRGISIWAENARKTYCVHGHPFNKANTILRSGGRRGCRTCKNTDWKAGYYRKKALGLDGNKDAN